MATDKVVWAKRPEAQDYRGAGGYLALLFPPAKTQKLMESFRRTSPLRFAAKDLLRASQLPLLSKDDPHVDSDLKRIRKGKSLPPVLLIRGEGSTGVPLIIADGYHRVCAICFFDENEPVSCILVSR